jgi:hypothetical protein
MTSIPMSANSGVGAYIKLNTMREAVGGKLRALSLALVHLFLLSYGLLILHQTLL